ncbi:MAG: glutamine--fructose-6-phosphate aminotransferase, partial [Parvibaculum sp.]
MCGIVGVLGTKPAAPIILEALRRLEYRGYDSAGIATLSDGQIERRRAEGKLVNLEVSLHSLPLDGTMGIGHTRWATHGAPTAANAHPHATQRVAIVHNGIIENFRELREKLIASGARFESETDSEAIAHLVSHY